MILHLELLLLQAHHTTTKSDVASFFFFFHFYTRMHTMCHGVHVEIRGQSVGTGFSSYYVGSRDWEQFIKLGGECLCPLWLSCLPCGKMFRSQENNFKNLQWFSFHFLLRCTLTVLLKIIIFLNLHWYNFFFCRSLGKWEATCQFVYYRLSYSNKVIYKQEIYKLVVAWYYFDYELCFHFLKYIFLPFLSGNKDILVFIIKNEVWTCNERPPFQSQYSVNIKQLVLWSETKIHEFVGEQNFTTYVELVVHNDTAHEKTKKLQRISLPNTPWK